MLPSPAAVATELRMATTPVASPTQARVSRVVAAMRPNCGRERIWFISIEFKAEGRWTMLPPGCAGKTGRHLVVDQGDPVMPRGLTGRGVLFIAFAFTVMADPVSSIAYAIESALRHL